MKKNITTVHLTHGVYFIVGEHSFDLYKKNSEKKNGKLLGYFTNMQNLINKATQAVMAEMQGDADFTGFIRKWNEIQQELAEYVSKYKF